MSTIPERWLPGSLGDCSGIKLLYSFGVLGSEYVSRDSCALRRLNIFAKCDVDSRNALIKWQIEDLLSAQA